MTEHKSEHKFETKAEPKAEVAAADAPAEPKAPPQLPEYLCHKKVRAGKITELDTGAGGVNADLGVDVHAGEPDVVTHCDKAWFDKNTPEVGGYIVIYEDGYTSYSPAAPFEAGYSPVTVPEVAAEAKPAASKGHKS